jgi:hypothetical protein
VKLIRYRRRVDSIPRTSRFQTVGHKRRGLSHSIDAFRSWESRTSIIFRRFLPWLGRPPTERRSSRPAPAAMSLARCLYNRCGIARCGFGGLAFDSVRERRIDRHQPFVAVRIPTIAVSAETIRKYRIETVSCREISITNACYLCNTLWKRGGPKPLEAVP